MIPADLVRDARRLLDIVKAQDFVRVIGHYDADGISSASVISMALKRLDVPFQTRILPNLSHEDAKLHVEGAESCVILTDLGSSTIEVLDAMRKYPIITIDHHAPPANARTDHVLQLNAHQYKLDGATEVSSSMLALAIAITWDEKNWDLIRPALMGAIGDKQVVIPPSGLNRYLIEEAKTRGLVEERIELSLDPGPMEDSLTYAIDPHFPSITDRTSAAAFLEKAGIPPKVRFSELNRSDRRKLTSLVLLDMASAGSEPEGIRTAVRRRFVYASDGSYADHLTRLIDSSGRSGMTGTAVALACGSKAARETAESIAMEFKKKVHEGTIYLKSKGIAEMQYLHHFRWDDPTVTGMLAEISTLYLGRHTKPVFGSAVSGQSVKVSSRTTRTLVAKGVDLNEACRGSAESCGGKGGGHNIAAGATIPLSALDQFLAGANKIIGEQLARKTM
jgi:RecJ-like exonuclease